MLWPSPPNKALPTATAQVWGGSQRPNNAVLHHLDDAELQKLLAAAGWFQAVREQVPTAAEDTLNRFLAQRLASLVPLLLPPETLRSAEHAH